MEIKTKYQIGQEHWVVESNLVQKESVRSIHIEIETRGDATPAISIKYKMNGGRYVDEDRIVQTKKDLLNSL